jgi:hypothetical protein
MTIAKTAASPDLHSCSGDEWTILGEGNANVVFSYGGRDPELVSCGRQDGKERAISFFFPSHPQPRPQKTSKKQSGLVLRLRKTKAKTQTALDRAVDAIVWAQLDANSDHSSAADRDAAFARRVVVPLLGPQYLLLPLVVAVPSELRLSLEGQLARNGRESRKAEAEGPGNGDGAAAGRGPSLEARGALLRDATLWENEKGTCASLCVELKPKCGLPHGTGRRTKVRLKQQQQQQQMQQQTASKYSSRYCPSDLFSGEAARRRRALSALLSDALARDFSHSAPRAAHFRLFGGNGEPLEGAAEAERAISELLLPPPSPPGRPSSSASSSSSAFKLLVAALDSILAFEPLLPRLLQAQRCPECPTAAVAAESLSVLREAAAVAKKEAPPCSKSSPSSSAAAVSAAASALRSYLVATSARDLSVMILLRGRGNQEVKEKTFLQRGAEATGAGGAVDLAAVASSSSFSSSSSSSLGSFSSLSVLRYRISLCDLDAKPSSKAELHAAADERLPRSGARRRGEK